MPKPSYPADKFIRRAAEQGIEASKFRLTRSRPYATNAAQVGAKLVYIKYNPLPGGLSRFIISPDFKMHGLFDFVAFLTPDKTYIISTKHLNHRTTEFKFDSSNESEPSLEAWEELRREYERRR